MRERERHRERERQRETERDRERGRERETEREREVNRVVFFEAPAVPVLKVKSPYFEINRNTTIQFNPHKHRTHYSYF